ncbi:MAG: Uncharacterized protein XE02_0666 [Mesotoga infera]|uniref:DUF368 domain-containing protein n=1 Tax=Mesotoga infera TaxID=1236046 RepID=A0A101I7I3_9BACT|nr:MAG: Uncharacterized protein XE02_0666 [Mesotoga infera]
MLYVVFIGVLMGLANLIPGVSGGTIALLGGLYERFVGSISMLTTLKIRREEMLFVFKRIEKLGISALLSLAAGVAIVVLISILSSRTGGVALTDHGAINLVYDVVAGFFGASAMVLPGLSGAFILLVMGEYTRAISAIKSFDLVIIAFIGDLITRPGKNTDLTLIVSGVILGIFVSYLLTLLEKRNNIQV